MRMPERGQGGHETRQNASTNAPSGGSRRISMKKFGTAQTTREAMSTRQGLCPLHQCLWVDSCSPSYPQSYPFGPVVACTSLVNYLRFKLRVTTDVSQGVLEGHRLVLICTPVFASGHLTNIDRGRFDSTRNDHGQPGCVRASIRIRSENVWPSRYVSSHSA